VDQSNTGTMDATTTESQASSTQQTPQASDEKLFTQNEVNNIVTKRLAQLEKKFSSINVDEYQELKTLKEQQDQEAAIKRQEFDRVLTQVKTASEAKIVALQKELETIKIDGALIAEASARKAVAPDKVAALLRSNLKLNQDGQVEVLDSQGQVRYNADKATPLAMSDLVDEFLKANPYFVAASPSGTGSRNAGQEANTAQINVADLDMRKPEHRELYRKMKATK
jgi:hypothetical protein